MNRSSHAVKGLALFFGALTDPLSDQLDKQGMMVDPMDVEFAQALADAITRLAIADVLTEGEVHRARKRLLKRIASMDLRRLG